jgi:hypothetical protein
MPPLLLETTTQGEAFTHRILWSACQRQLAVARAEERGSWYFHLSAMLMCFMSLEAYVNFLGTKLAPALWADERNTFRTGKYAGTAGKLLKLCEIQNVPFPDKGTRPYQSVAALKKLRDLIAHGKPDEVEMTVTHTEHEEPPFIKYTLESFVSGPQAEQAIADARDLMESLHAQFVARAGSELIQSKALEGMLAMSSGSTGEA